MKVLIIINNLGVGGAERLVIDDIHELLRRGVEVTLLTLKPEKSERTLSEQLHLPKEKWLTIHFGSLLNIKSWFRVWRVVKEVEPDALITHLWYSNTIGKVVGCLLGIKKIIAFEHNVYDTLKTRKMFLIDRLTQFIPTKVIAVSQAVKKSLLKHGIEEKRIAVIQNGIDVSKYTDLPKARNEIFTYIFVGRLIRQKGVDILLQAFATVPNARLKIVGRGAEEEALKKIVSELGLTERIEFLGTRQDVPELLKSADCFVLPSRYEGLPMVLLEAIAAGNLIIVSDFESATEVITNEESGLIIPKENVEALVRAMKRVMQDEPLQQKLLTHVQKIAPTVSIENHVDQLLKFV